MNDNITNRPADEPKSPFAMFDTDTEKPVFLQHQQPNHHLISDLDRLILLRVNRQVILTSHQINKILCSEYGLEIEKRSIQGILAALFSSNYLNSIRFGSTKGYILGRRAIPYLYSIGATPNKPSYISSCSTEKVKAILATNQFLIQCGISIKTIQLAQVVLVPTKDGTSSGRIFRATALYEQNGRTIFVESVRNTPVSMNDFIDKLDRIQDVLSSPTANITIKNQPQLVVIAESNEHMQILINEIRKRRYSYEIAITNDLLTYNSPEDCLTKIESDNARLFNIFSIARPNPKRK